MRQVSRAEAAKLGGATGAPARDMREWTNPRTGERIRVDRGLDPAWATNPGLHREWILAEDALVKIGALPGGLAREAVRQFVDSPLLGRHLSGRGQGGPPRGDLPVGSMAFV